MGPEKAIEVEIEPPISHTISEQLQGVKLLELEQVPNIEITVEASTQQDTMQEANVDAANTENVDMQDVNAPDVESQQVEIQVDNGDIQTEPVMDDGDDSNKTEKTLNPQEWQIGWAGKDCLKDSFDRRKGDRESVVQFIGAFQKLRSLDTECINPLLRMMQLGGVTRNRLAKDVMNAMLDNVKAKIKTLDQESLQKLLDRSFSYLTVPQLQPIAVGVLERLQFVEPEMWGQIIENGLDESPYVDLPLAIKKRIWQSRIGSKALDHEVDELINRLPDAAKPQNLEELSLRVDRARHRQITPPVHELNRMAKDLSDDHLAQIVERTVQRAAQERGLKREAIANLFHQFMLNVKTKVDSNNLTTLRTMATFLYKENIDGKLGSAGVRDIRHALSLPTSCGPVALLISSTYSRDLLADQLVMFLLSRRGKVENFEDTDLVATATAHVKADIWIPDLTYLCIANVKADYLLGGGGVLTETEVEEPFDMLFPLIINEMHADVSQSQDEFFNQNGALPNDALTELVISSRLARRVLTTYCLQLYTQGILVGYSRFRLMLDACLKVLDPAEEAREACIAYNVIVKIIES